MFLHRFGLIMLLNVPPVRNFSSEAVENVVEETREVIVVNQIVAMLPSAESRGYFGPRRERPPNQVVRRARQTEPIHVGRENFEGVQDRGSSDSFPPFNPKTDISIGHFVALSVV